MKDPKDLTNAELLDHVRTGSVLTGETLEELCTRFEAFEKAGRKFVEKVENGHAHSVETYNDFKTCLQ